MATIKPFRGLRPLQELAEKMSCPPYDVMNQKEAEEMSKGNEYSFLHITRAEIDCPKGTDIHSETVYEKSVENYNRFINNGWLKKDENPKFYIYAQTMGSHTQYGIVGCAACEDYEKGIIKKHELTRPEKEDDRMILTRYTNANIEPVFFSYRAVKEIDTIVSDIVNNQSSEYDFVADDGFKHQFWTINEPSKNNELEKLFTEKVPYTYVADGHHRTAAAARIGIEKKQQNPKHSGKEEYNYFMAVHFPDDQLQIIDYNRVVKDLNKISVSEFLEKLNNSFDVIKKGNSIYKPSNLHELSMYLDGNWYQLKAKDFTFDDNDPIGALDVTILSEQVLKPLLDIQDLRTSRRIDFVGGIRGLEALQQRVDSGEMAVAFALYPVSMKQLLNIADTGNIMPPKTTWFEPKLRSGLIIHQLD